MGHAPIRRAATQAARFAVRLIDAALTAAIALMVALAAAFAAWSAWDTGRVYSEAEGVREELLALKPAEESPALDGLTDLNPDVRAWLTLDGTRIDYPVVQGETNFDYLHTDVHGEYSLAGSVFLDSGCDGGFDSAYSLVYGHHMADGGMFGSLDEYADPAFFAEHRTGTLVLPGGSRTLGVLAFLPTNSGDDNVYNPHRWAEDATGLLDHVEARATLVDLELLAEARKSPDVQLVALTTCASGSEDARTAVICVMSPDAPSSRR